MNALKLNWPTVLADGLYRLVAWIDDGCMRINSVFFSLLRLVGWIALALAAAVLVVKVLYAVYSVVTLKALVMVICAAVLWLVWLVWSAE